MYFNFSFGPNVGFMNTYEIMFIIKTAALLLLLQLTQGKRNSPEPGPLRVDTGSVS